MDKIEIGDKVRDKISGFVGIVTSRSESAFSSPLIQVTAQVLKDGRVCEEWFHEGRLEVLPQEAETKTD